jgi:hypothetical protein
MTKRAAILFVAVAIAAACYGHVGSPDVYFQGEAGPYHLVVAVMTPQMIPGVAEIQIRVSEPGVRQVKIVPLYIVGEASKYPPPPDVLMPSKDDPQFFSGKLWLMASGSWQVRVEADGDQGSGTLAVPVPAAARATLPMHRELGTLLGGLMVLLVAAIVSIFGAARREGQLDPGVAADARDRRGARLAMAVTFVIAAIALALGGWWWKVDAASLANRMIYKRPELFVSLDGDDMKLRIGESGWHARRQEVVSTRLIPDHGHLMHVFLIRMPQMDRFYHLHPRTLWPLPPGGEGPISGAFMAVGQHNEFIEELPAIVAGRYQVFADIVRDSGFPDTLIAETYIPEVEGHALTGDDSEATAVPLVDQAVTSSSPSPAATGNLVSPLGDGARMLWQRDAGPLRSNELLWFRFRVERADGKPVSDLEPYMGMAGHAEFVRSDFSVFAHVHPDGSAPMAAVALADATLPGASGAIAKGPMANMPGMPSEPIGSEVSFPYGFPKPGLYRIFVQVKRGGRVETGVFDAQVN